MAARAKLLGSIAGDDAIEARADREQEIAVLQREVRAARRHRAGPADEQWCSSAMRSMASQVRLERNVEHVDQLAEFALGARQADAVAASSMGRSARFSASIDCREPAPADAIR